MQRCKVPSYAHSELSRRILAAAFHVHRQLGPGLLESTYRVCLARQLEIDGLACDWKVSIPVHYEGVEIACAYRADAIVQRAVLLELESVERLLPIHTAQVLTYLELTGLDVALLLNFNVHQLRNGMRRLVR